jgi:hypothetical protein
VKLDKNPHGVQLPSIGCYDGKEPPGPRMEGSFFKVKGKESKLPWNGFRLHVCLSQWDEEHEKINSGQEQVLRLAICIAERKEN